MTKAAAHTTKAVLETTKAANGATNPTHKTINTSPQTTKPEPTTTPHPINQASPQKNLSQTTKKARKDLSGFIHYHYLEKFASSADSLMSVVLLIPELSFTSDELGETSKWF
jgi:hypothetical protein